MENKAPLKRHPALHHLSHDHHHGLLLCWKIRQGFKLEIESERIKIYCVWFWENHLETHFEEEEKVIFPVLSAENSMIKQALSEHKRLRKLFSTWENPEKTLGQIEEKLEKHIRFEERVLFPLVQEKATAEQLQAISAHGVKEKFEENNSDPFWIGSA
ncbi:MAG: hemerythrin domain-containing protein [Algoriphagus sp.]|jgi:iron-sulfur cluster repair protein YtfE (RIC family)|uniref:hemerythrin domain-containing protein n=1 Tax=Algoriphagus sp. TaxID=1872435 RepID=UPI002721FA41|nr:hemerythrin domain-containing protein [Algoriphagus sp.]MDO8966095.1 hemerythrin domain-containing protein [Algoriphagus sp.]MDP2043503.1 hemerythrin domain-containing protein [Algoriphagus sp.]MDP3199228.1 hemerythrin domain-containing protein [Algoriphagus sp.]MDP3472435.1 hemerythrin domain-containing protein [Algoriphagus sp.]